MHDILKTFDDAFQNYADQTPRWYAAVDWTTVRIGCSVPVPDYPRALWGEMQFPMSDGLDRDTAEVWDVIADMPPYAADQVQKCPEGLGLVVQNPYGYSRGVQLQKAGRIITLPEEQICGLGRPNAAHRFMRQVTISSGIGADRYATGMYNAEGAVVHLTYTGSKTGLDTMPLYLSAVAKALQLFPSA